MTYSNYDVLNALRQTMENDGDLSNPSDSPANHGMLDVMAYLTSQSKKELIQELNAFNAQQDKLDPYADVDQNESIERDRRREEQEESDVP